MSDHNSVRTNASPAKLLFLALLMLIVLANLVDTALCGDSLLVPYCSNGTHQRPSTTVQKARPYHQSSGPVKQEEDSSGTSNSSESDAAADPGRLTDTNLENTVDDDKGRVIERPRNASVTELDNATIKREEHNTEASNSPESDTAADLKQHTDSNGESRDDDKGRVIEILRNASITELDNATLNELPRWSQVATLYGETPRVVGLETCEAFRDSIPTAQRYVAPAGLMNTGTNFVEQMLRKNCRMGGRVKGGVLPRVPWYKHTPISFLERDERGMPKAPPANGAAVVGVHNILPIVMIKDPFTWMRSMCRVSYWARWKRSQIHCPNLVTNEQDRRMWNIPPNQSSVEVRLGMEGVYQKNFTKHDSLAHLWNDWYGPYLNATFPRLMVRYEDLLFHGDQVLRDICTCAGGELKSRDIKYVVDSTKGSSSVGLVKSFIRYGSDKHRFDGMEMEDRKFAEQHLSRQLINIFGYAVAPRARR